MQINPTTFHEWENTAGMIGYCKKLSQKQNLSYSRFYISVSANNNLFIVLIGIEITNGLK